MTSELKEPSNPCQKQDLDCNLIFSQYLSLVENLNKKVIEPISSLNELTQEKKAEIKKNYLEIQDNIGKLFLKFRSWKEESDEEHLKRIQELKEELKKYKESQDYISKIEKINDELFSKIKEINLII